MAIDVSVAGSERETLAAWLVARTGQAVEEREDGTIVTYAHDEGAADELTAAILLRNGRASVTRRALDEIDWSTRWRDGLGPRRFGRLTLVPSWIDYTPGSDEIVVMLDPEMAFGSGEHGSTRSALHLLERHVPAGGTVLDLGSGSGILAIAACRLGARRAIGIEIDDDANPIARRNAERNRVDRSTEFISGDAASLAPLLGPAELICSNILRTVNLALFPSIKSSLGPEGRVIFSGMEEAEAVFFRPELDAAGFEVVDEAIDAGWWSVFTRIRC
jgi:ribosomal protein L11 methyltransferase